MLSPATPTFASPTPRPPRTLNEGRDVKPGDTYRGRLGVVYLPAQRSTKAGMLSPATHVAHPRAALGEQLRSTKAGMLSPATPATPTLQHEHQLLRSTKAGMLSPATLSARDATSNGERNAQRRPGC